MYEILLVPVIIIGFVLFLFVISIRKSKQSQGKRPINKPTKSEEFQDDPSDQKETWQCLNCGYENDEDDDICENCGASRDSYDDSGDYVGASALDFGGDPLWDDDQGLM
jgi:hypothetical protein